MLGDYYDRLLVYRVQGLQSKICQSKAQYAQSLRNLEDISESIHERQVFFLLLKGEAHEICQSKAQYAQSLRNLEDISESIHERQVFFIKGTSS